MDFDAIEKRVLVTTQMFEDPRRILTEDDYQTFLCAARMLEKVRGVVESACKTSEDGNPVKYGEYDGDGDYIVSDELPSITALEAALVEAREENVGLQQDQQEMRECAESYERLYVEACEEVARLNKLLTAAYTRLDELDEPAPELSEENNE